MHQGDLDGTKGLYHINAVDCGTQWQVVATVQTISAASMSTTGSPRCIAQRHARCLNTYCREYLNAFLNFHRPCLFSTDIADPNKPGRIKRVYRPRDAMTPLDKLASLPETARGLREGITLQHLRELATALTDVQAADELNEARLALFRRVPARSG